MIETRHGSVWLNYYGHNNPHTGSVLAYFYPGSTPQMAKDLEASAVRNNVDLAAKGLVVVGKMSMDSRDRYSKKFGRKKAIAKALNASKLTKEQRAEVWQDIRCQMRLE